MGRDRHNNGQGSTYQYRYTHLNLIMSQYFPASTINLNFMGEVVQQRPQDSHFSEEDGKENHYCLLKRNSSVAARQQPPAKSKQEDAANYQPPLSLLQQSKNAFVDPPTAEKALHNYQQTEPSPPQSIIASSHSKMVEEPQSASSSPKSQPQPACSHSNLSVSSAISGAQGGFLSELPDNKMIMIREGQFSRNRSYLYVWMRRECEKSRLQWETFANAVALMDQFYKYFEFQKDSFVMHGLLFIIISSKALEVKVLFTSVIAQVNRFDNLQMAALQLDILNFFEFKVTAYNFVHVAGEFMRRWDEELEAMGARRDYLFAEPHPLSYLQYLEVLFLCESHMRHKGSLLVSAIRRIFTMVLKPRCKDVDAPAILERIFSRPCRQAAQEYLFAYELKSQKEQETIRSVEAWREEFAKTIPAMQARFSRYEQQKDRYKCYGEFLSLLLLD